MMVLLTPPPRRPGKALFNVIVLDCCRDNPLPQTMRSANGGGLMAMSPSSSLVAYACAATQQAAERHGRGIFTKHLLSYIERPGLNIVDLFNVHVGNAVEEETSDEKFYPQKQRPVVMSSLRVPAKDACLVPQ